MTNENPIIQKFRSRFTQSDEVQPVGVGYIHPQSDIEELESFLLEVDKQAREEEKENITHESGKLMVRYCLQGNPGDDCNSCFLLKRLVDTVYLSDLQHQERKEDVLIDERVDVQPISTKKVKLRITKVVNKSGMKTCSKCGETKTLEEFSKNKKASDGTGTYCKSCVNSHMRAYMKTDAYKKYHAKKVLEWVRNNREKARAHYAAHRLRKILKDDKCSLCPTTTRLEQHHPDYTKPKYTITLCGSCHRKQHPDPFRTKERQTKP